MNYGDYSLSDDALELLKTAARGKNGMIRRIPMAGGLRVSAGGKEFTEAGNPRSEAQWREALNDLEFAGLVEGVGHQGMVFQLTHSGFRLADKSISD